MVDQYLQLVYSIANNLARKLPSHIEVDDLVQEGVLGLIDALKRYKVQDGVNFTAYASTRIKGSIFDYLRASDHLSKNRRKDVQELSSVITSLSHELGHEPRLKDVSNRTGASVPTVAATLLDGYEMVLSYDTFCEDNNHDHIKEFQDHKDPLTVLLDKEKLRLMHECITKHLDKRERFILLSYYTKDRTMAEIGKDVGVCESRVSHLVKHIVAKMNQFLTEKGVAQCLL